MKKIVKIAALLGLSMALTGCVDQSGGAASADEARIIATSVAVCEITDALGIDLVGVPTTSYTLPERYSDVQEVGSPMAPDMEIIKSLNPTEIISPSSLEYDLGTQYETLGLQGTFINLKSVEGLYEGVESLGEKYGKIEEVERLITDFEDFMADYTAKYEEADKPRVLILMGLPGSYVAATENAYVGNLVKLAGGENVFAGETEEFINVNTEALLETNPDIILRTSHALPEQVAQMFEEEFSTSDIWKHFTAVQEEKVYDLSYELFGMSAGFDYKEALADLESILYEGKE